MPAASTPAHAAPQANLTPAAPADEVTAAQAARKLQALALAAREAQARRSGGAPSGQAGPTPPAGRGTLTLHR
jgi:hypothetical protein